jgi:hypothetical protein
VTPHLKPLSGYILVLLFLNIFILGTGYCLVLINVINLVFIDIAILAAGFSLFSLLTLIIFLRGQTKEPDSQTLHSLFSISLKFLLEMVLALVWFILAKKRSLTSIVLFFVLYLTFTLFSLMVILKTLKNKSL